MTTTHPHVRGTIEIPEGKHTIPATSHEDIDKAIAEVRAQADAWVATDIPARIELLQHMMEDTEAVAEHWVRTACDAKRIAYDTPTAGENWFGPVLLLRNLRLLKASLKDIQEHGHPQLPGEPYARPDGQVVAPVFPTDMYEKTLYDRMTAEVWMDPDVTLDDLHEHWATAYRHRDRFEGKVALVLGAGNVGAIPATDTINKLFNEHQVVILKMNPVNEHIGPYLEQALRVLIERGFLRVVYGGVEEGRYLTGHDGIDEIHITGSDKTHDAIVFGPGEEGRQRKEAGEPVLDKRITSELGNVTPVIVVPGPWSKSDLRYHARNIATQIVNNAGFNCIAVRNVVTHRAWSQRRDLLDAIREELRSAPDRHPYYPGARDRWEEFVADHPEAERYGDDGPGCVPWTLIPELDPDSSDEIAFDTEAFNGVFGEVALDAPRDVAAYLDRAVEFCNERLWGTLAASIIVHPRSLKDPEVEAALDRAIADLRYGTVAVNHWSGLGYALMTTTWGAFPGHPLTDIGSGQAVVHNTFLFDRPQKAVVRGPFRTLVEPPWFLTHRRGHEAYERVVGLEADPSPAKMPGVLSKLLRP